jgi:hypothetical protein
MQRNALRNAKRGAGQSKEERRNCQSSFETLGLFSLFHDCYSFADFFIAKNAEECAEEREAKEQESPIFFK